MTRHLSSNHALMRFRHFRLRLNPRLMCPGSLVATTTSAGGAIVATAQYSLSGVQEVAQER